VSAGLAHLFGDYVVQTDHMARTKTAPDGAASAAAHAATYTACYLPLTRNPRALAIIGGTHYVIDRYRLAKHLVWLRNQAAPTASRYPRGKANPFGGHPDQPDWLAGWLLFLADNAVHIAINEWALRRWPRG
jgi:hypothetical protein